MTELGPDEKRWLEALRASDEPRREDRDRIRAAVLASVAGGVAATGAAAGAASAMGSGGGAATGAATGAGAAATVTAKALGGLTAWKAILGLASLAIVTGGSVYIARDRAAQEGMAVAATPTSAPAPTEIAAPSAAARAAEPAASAPIASVVAETTTLPERAAPVAARGLLASPRASVPRATTDNVEAELALLSQAQRALRDGKAEIALEALGRHAQEFPRGALSVEREGLRAVATCEAKRPEGRSLAERFAARHPDSPLVARVRAACAAP